MGSMPQHPPTRYSPTDPAGLAALCADACLTLPGRVAVGVDGADPAHPDALAETITELLRVRGRPAAVVRVVDFITPASLRLERGAHDEESFGTSWYDFAAISREVVDALHTQQRWLPRLWDSVSDRSFRDQRRDAADNQVILIAGPMAVRKDLQLDLGIALRMSAAALRRGLPADDHWTIGALLEHQTHSPEPDIEVRYDHPDRPAVALSCRVRPAPRR